MTVDKARHAGALALVRAVCAALVALGTCSCTTDLEPPDRDASSDTALLPDMEHDPVPDPLADLEVPTDAVEDLVAEEPATPLCRNGVIEDGEACDTGYIPCVDLDHSYVTGMAPCAADCLSYEAAACLTLDGLMDLVARAAEITGEAEMVLMGMDLVGLYEWEVKEIVDDVFEVHGADAYPAFPHIVASGPNALELHYFGSSRQIREGDLVLVDIGARYSGYCGDITRTFPAGGTFTPRQRELWQLVLDAQAGAAAVMRPDVQSLDDMYFWTLDFFATSPLRALDEYGVERTMDHFFIHGLCHYIGADVHGADLGWSTTVPARLGQVFAIEPGLYIPSEGIGIRIEDDFVLTPDGAVSISLLPYL